MNDNTGGSSAFHHGRLAASISKPAGKLRLSAIGIAAAALAAGLQSAPAAYALPPFPAAPPACTDYIWPSGGFTINQDNNIVAAFNTNGARFDGPGASYVQPGGGKPPTRGSSTGSRSGRDIMISGTWENGMTSQYTGRIDNDLVARGTTVNNQGVTNSWVSAGKFQCVTPPSPPPPVTGTGTGTGTGAPDAGETPPLAPQGTTATVTIDLDVYNAPGGNDGDKRDGFIEEGSTVQLLERRDDNWCLVSGPAVPGGDGWAFGDYIK